MKRDGEPDRVALVKAAIAKYQSAAWLLVETGPPNEWSGGVAGVLGKEGRKRLTGLWNAITAAEQKRVLDAFHKMFDAIDVVMELEDAYGALAKAPLVKRAEPVFKLTGSPRNKYGTHSSKHGFKGNYEQAWKLHFSQLAGGSLGVAATGPLRGTVRRVSMIAATMKPQCKLAPGDNVAPRGGPKSPLSGSYPETAKDYGLTEWAKPGNDGLKAEDLTFSCSDLAIIKRTALAEIRRRAADRARAEEEQAKAIAKRTAVPEVMHFSTPIPDGSSGLPESLEKVVPDELRYWKVSDANARIEKRDQLIRSRLFTTDTLRIVDGELRATTTKRYLFEKGDELPARPTTFAAQLASIIPKGRDYRHPFLTKDWRACLVDCDDVPTTLFVVSPTDSDICPHEVAAALDPIEHADWFLEWDDTPEARAAFKEVGRPFKLLGSERLFCASFAIERNDGEWVGKDVTVTKPFAGYDTFDDCVADQVRQGKPDEQARAICGALQRDMEKVLKCAIPILKTKEERYVLGIVLEPNDGKAGAPLDPDSQSDIYSAKDVRDAAHRYMEHHRNLGLMHREFITGAARILESYIAPIDFSMNGTKVREGTWLLAIRVVDDELWRRIKSEEFTGFSIGGSAIRRPVADGR